MNTIATFAHEQAYLIAIVIGIGYVFVAAGRWNWTMLPDAALGALYVWRPSLGMLAFVLLLGIVRHTPALAHELSTMFRLAEFDGWTQHLIGFVLPTLAHTTPTTGKTTVLDMSSVARVADSKSAVARPLPATSESAGQRIATPGNGVNDVLPGNPLPEDVRNIIRFQRAVEAVVALVGSGKMGKTEAIEIVFGCKRSGRVDSPYARANAAVQEKLGPDVPLYRPLTEDQQAAREELGL